MRTDILLDLSEGDRGLTDLLGRIGFRVEQTKRGVYKIYPPLSIGGRMYTTHGTPKAMKAIKSEFRKIYGIDLASI